MIKINLHQYRTGTSKIFSGRDKGIGVRKEKKLDEIDKNSEQVVVSIPKDTWTINSSFFGGLFEKSVIDLGREKFLEKYTFVFDDGSVLSSELRQNIDEGIHDALNEI